MGFDEGVDDQDIPTPYYIHVNVYISFTLLPETEEKITILSPPIEVRNSTFPSIHEISFKVAFENDTLGFIFHTFPYRYHIYLYVFKSCT